MTLQITLFQYLAELNIYKANEYTLSIHRFTVNGEILEPVMGFSILDK